ncbi:three-helix bundle dimerization domain-containing protein [Microbacterium deminutum]
MDTVIGLHGSFDDASVRDFVPLLIEREASARVQHPI